MAMSEQAPTNRDRSGKAGKKAPVRIAKDAEVAALAEDSNVSYCLLRWFWMNATVQVDAKEWRLGMPDKFCLSPKSRDSGCCSAVKG